MTCKTNHRPWTSLALALLVPLLAGSCNRDRAGQPREDPAAGQAVKAGAGGTRPAPPAKAPARGKEVRVAGRDWGYPSPYAFYPRGPGYVRMTLLFDTLAWRDEKGVVPWLARKWTASADGKSWTVELVDNATWHDGKPVGPGDVAFTIGYLKRHRHPWFDLSMVSGAEALDGRRVKITLSRPYAVFVTRILMRTPMLPAHIWKDVKDPRRFTGKAALVGSGPFVLETYDPVKGSYVFAANPRHFKGRPRIDRLIFVPTKKGDLALLKGQVDMTRVLKVDSLGMFKGKPEFKILPAPDYWLFRLVVNFNEAPVRDARFRRALAHALDRAEMVKRVAHGGGVAGTWGYVSPASAWHNPRTADYPHDPARARALLDRLGFKDRDGDGLREDPRGKGLTLVLLSDKRFARAAEVVKKYLAGVGLAARIHSADVSTHDADIRRMKGFHLALTAHGGITGDLGNLTGGLVAIAGYKDAEYLKLVREQPFLADPAARKKALWRIQEIIARDVATVPLYYLRWYHVYRPAAFDGWFYARHGLPLGVMLLEKKLAFLR